MGIAVVSVALLVLKLNALVTFANAASEFSLLAFFRSLSLSLPFGSF